MAHSLPDRLLILFVLETSWLVCALRLMDVPQRGGPTPDQSISLMMAGAAVIAVALLVPRLVRFTTTAVVRSVGVVLFVPGIVCGWTVAGEAAGGVGMACFGLVLALSGAMRQEPPRDAATG